MGKWTDTDTSNYSGDSSGKVSAAEHQAREDATKDGVFERGNDSKNSERFNRDDKSGKEASGFWNSVFGSKK